MIELIINKDELKRRIYTYTFAKSQFSKNNIDTFSADDPLATVSGTPIEGITVNENVCTITYDIEDIKASIAAITKQKSRFLKAVGAKADDLNFESEPVITENYIIPLDDLFLEVQTLSAIKAKVLGSDKGDFSRFIITSDDRKPFDILAKKAISDLDAVLFEYISISINTITLTGTYTNTKAIKRAIESYIVDSVMEQYYKMFNIDLKLNTSETLMQLSSIFTKQQDKEAILSDVINEASILLQTALYPLCRNLRPEVKTFEISSTNIIYRFEAANVSSSAAQLIYRTGLNMLINGSLAKWFTLAGVQDDKNEEKQSLATALESLQWLINDRVRFVGLLDDFLKNAITEIRTLLSSYNKELLTDDYIIEGSNIKFLLLRPQWEDEKAGSPIFAKWLTDATDKLMFSKMLLDWYQLSENSLFIPTQEDYTASVKAFLSHLHVQNQPRGRRYEWF